VTAFVQALFADNATNYAIALLIALPLVDFLTGVLRAFANGTFELHRIDVFVRTQIAGRALPLIVLLILGRAITVSAPDALVIPGLDLSILTTGGLIAAVPFLVATAKSILDNVNPSTSDRLPSATEEAIAVPGA
jgi:hypothetical protein